MLMYQTRKIDPKAVWNIKKNFMDLDSAITEGFKLEAQGRKIASEREGYITIEDKTWASDLCIWHNNFERFTYRYNTFDPIPFYDDLTHALISGNLLFLRIEDWLYFKIANKTRNIILVSEIEDVDTLKELIFDRLKIYDEEQYKLSHRSGIWLYNSIPINKYSYSALVNDATSVFHQLLNFVMRSFQNITVIVPNKLYSVGAGNPYLENLAKEWYKTTEFLESQNIYHLSDYPSLFAVIKPDEAEFSVGSTVGHVTHIEPRIRGIVADYYDTDENVHRVVMRLAEYWGINVVEHDEEEMTKFFAPRLNGCDEIFIKAVLPFVTSMDFRLSESSKYWRYSKWKDQYKNVRSKVSNYEDLEIQMCIIAGSELI